jgi:hypothetical protein
MRPDRQAPLRCPKAYSRAVLPRDTQLLRAFLDSFFTQSVFIDKLIDRYNPNIYCDDAFRQIEYFDYQGCIKGPVRLGPCGAAGLAGRRLRRGSPAGAASAGCAAVHSSPAGWAWGAQRPHAVT